jgi:hypothetical protein
MHSIRHKWKCFHCFDLEVAEAELDVQ